MPEHLVWLILGPGLTDQPSHGWCSTSYLAALAELYNHKAADARELRLSKVVAAHARTEPVAGISALRLLSLPLLRLALCIDG